MKLLLDTHAFIWTAASPELFSLDVRDMIAQSTNEVFVSAAVAWEISIKHAFGKLSLPGEPTAWFPARMHQLGFRQLPITVEHALAVHALPALHNDPFDRIMIAQAQIEGLTLVSADVKVQQYSIRVIH